jgi:hypothetical protein
MIPPKMQNFGSQEISNILHILAKQRYKSSILQQLEGRAEEISAEFNSQHLANTLWAFATMGTKPGQRLMGQLEGRAKAI